MIAPLRLPLARTRTALVWLAFALAFVLATKPVWGLWAFGYEPSLDDLLSLRCFSRL